MASFGTNLRMYRIRRGLTQEELGAITGDSKQTIYKYECDIIDRISLTKVEIFAAALGVRPAVLCGWESE